MDAPVGICGCVNRESAVKLSVVCFWFVFTVYSPASDCLALGLCASVMKLLRGKTRKMKALVE